MGKIVKSPNGVDSQVDVHLDMSDILNETVFFQKDGQMWAYGPFQMAIRNLAWRKLHLHNQPLASQPWKHSDIAVEGGSAVVRFYQDTPVVPVPPEAKQ